MLKVLNFVVLILPLAYAQIPGFGRCPNIPVVSNFDLSSFLGQWYEYERYPFIFEIGGKCTYARYGSMPDGNVSVYNYNINTITNRKSDISGTAEVKAPGKLLVRFGHGIPGGSNYWVLGTDYTSYAVAYTCIDILNIFNTKVVWVLTRDRKPSPAVITQAESILESNNLSTRYLMKTNQDNCPEN